MTSFLCLNLSSFYSRESQTQNMKIIINHKNNNKNVKR